MGPKVGWARSATTTAVTPFASSHPMRSFVDGRTPTSAERPWTNRDPRFAIGITPTYPSGIRKEKSAVACQAISSPASVGMMNTFSSGRSTDA